MTFFESMKMATGVGRPEQPQTFYGYVTAYDPVTHTIKAKFALIAAGTISNLPVETGWIPLHTPFAGAGWGFQAAPALDGNDQVLLLRVGASLVAFGPFFHDLHLPPGTNPVVNPGELWLTHKDGQQIKLTNDGKITILGGTGSIIVQAAFGQSINLQVSGGGIVKVNGGSKAVARVGDRDSNGDSITSGSSVLFTD